MIDNHLSALWPTVKLGDVLLDMQPGFAMRPGRSDRGVPQLRTNNVSPEGTLDLSEVKHVAASPAEIEKYAVRRGDVIFNNTNSVEWVGKTALFDSDKAFVLSNHMTRLRANEGLLIPGFLARYLHYLWKTGVVRRWTKQWVNQAAIDQAALAQFQIPLPPSPEQSRIVTILRQADDLRRLRRQADDNTQKLLSALFHEMFGDPATNSEGWSIRPVGELLRSSPHYGVFSPPSDNGAYLDLRVGNIVNDRLDLSDCKYIDLDEKGYKRFRVWDGDILLARAIGSAALLGKCAVFRGEREDIVFDSHLMRLQFKTEEVVPEYFHACITSSGGRYLLSRYIRASAVQFNINTQEMQAVVIPVPPFQMQLYFLNRIEALRKCAAVQNAAGAKLNDLLQSLSAQAFTGELTAAWREKHTDELREAAAQRDAALGLQAERQELVAPIQEYAPEPLARWAQRPVMAELDEFTQKLLRLAESQPAYFRSEDLSQDGTSVVETEESLRLLSALGFVRPVQVRGQLRYRLVDPVNERALPEESEV